MASRGIGVVLMWHWRGSGADGLKWTEPGRFKMHLNFEGNEHLACGWSKVDGASTFLNASNL